MPLIPSDARLLQASLPPLEEDWSERANKRAALEAETRNRDAMARANAAEAQQRERALADEALIQRLGAETGGAPDKVYAGLLRLSPSAAQKYGSAWADQRKKDFDAAKAEHEKEALALKQNLGLIEYAKARPELWPAIRAQAIKNDPEMEPLLPQQFDPQAVEHIWKIGLDADKLHAQEAKSLEYLVKGDWHRAAAMAYSTATNAEDKDRIAAGLIQQKVPREVVESFGPWSPTFAADALARGMTPDQRVDNERQAAAAANTERHQIVLEGQGERRTQAAELRARRTGGGGDYAPVQVVDPATGKVVWTTRAGAIGKEAPRAGGASGDGLAPRVETTVRSLSTAFRNEAAVKRAVTMGEAVSFVNSLDKNTTSPADDQALIYAFAKAMDPESVVREGEYATVAKYAQSWLSRFGFDAMRVLSSNAPILTPQARDNLKKTITTRFSASRGTYDNLVKSYVQQINKATGKDDGMDRLTDYGAVFPGGSSGAAQTTTGGSGQSGTTRRDIKGGGVAELRNGKWIRVE